MAAALNPNWPNLRAEAAFGSNPYFNSAATYYTDLTPRLYGPWSVPRGKQAELDQVQSTEFTGQWTNKDGFLDPLNGSSPFAPGVVPFRGWRMRAYWPPSVNLLDGDVSTGGEVTPLSPGASSPLVAGSYATPVVAASGTAWQGTQVWQVSVAGAATTGQTLIAFGPTSVLATSGTPYTVTYHLRSATTGANPVVTPFLLWQGITGTTIATTTASTVTLTGSPTATFTTVTQNGTVPSGAVALTFGATLTTAPGSSWTFQADGMQLEQTASASAFATPGQMYPVYSGMIERYPQSWMYNGTYGLVTPVAVDAMAQLSQTILTDCFTHEVTKLGPDWFFRLDDPGSATTFTEQAGRKPAAGMYSSTTGTGVLTPGTAITSTTPSGLFLGAEGPVLNVANPASGGTVVDLRPAGIGGLPAGGLTRMIAFRTTTTAAGGNALAGTTAGLLSGPFKDYWELDLISSGTQLFVQFNNAANHLVTATNTSVVTNDGNWHLAVVTLSANGQTVNLWIDGNVATASSGGQDQHPTNATYDSVGGAMYPLSGNVASNFAGDLAHYAQWSTVLTNGQIANLYSAWRTAFSGESSGSRYTRVAGYAGYTGPMNIDTGSTLNMGPCNDISGTDALAALQNIVNTEAGQHFVAAGGALTFQGRSRRYLAATPVAVFGENAAGGELPYSSLTIDDDTTRISNAIAITQVSTNQEFSASNTTSQSAYGTRTMTRANQSASGFECQDAASFYLSRYKDPHPRISQMVINVAANPALFPSALALELGQRVRINRRPPSPAPAITMDGFIEQVTHTADDQGNWTTSLEVSPAISTPYAVFTSIHATLKNPATAGSGTIVLNPLADAATNPAAGSLCGGQQLVIDFGAGTQETVTIATGGVPTTVPGYTSVTVTLTANLTQNHSASALVCEPMPAGVTSATVYDTFAVFDTAQFAY